MREHKNVNMVFSLWGEKTELTFCIGSHGKILFNLSSNVDNVNLIETKSSEIHELELVFC